MAPAAAVGHGPGQGTQGRGRARAADDGQPRPVVVQRTGGQVPIGMGTGQGGHGHHHRRHQSGPVRRNRGPRPGVCRRGQRQCRPAGDQRGRFAAPGAGRRRGDGRHHGRLQGNCGRGEDQGHRQDRAGRGHEPARRHGRGGAVAGQHRAAAGAVGRHAGQPDRGRRHRGHRLLRHRTGHDHPGRDGRCRRGNQRPGRGVGVPAQQAGDGEGPPEGADARRGRGHVRRPYRWVRGSPDCEQPAHGRFHRWARGWRSGSAGRRRRRGRGDRAAGQRRQDHQPVGHFPGSGGRNAHLPGRRPRADRGSAPRRHAQRRPLRRAPGTAGDQRPGESGVPVEDARAFRHPVRIAHPRHDQRGRGHHLPVRRWRAAPVPVGQQRGRPGPGRAGGRGRAARGHRYRWRSGHPAGQVRHPGDAGTACGRCRPGAAAARRAPRRAGGVVGRNPGRDHRRPGRSAAAGVARERAGRSGIRRRGGAAAVPPGRTAGTAERGRGAVRVSEPGRARRYRRLDAVPAVQAAHPRRHHRHARPPARGGHRRGPVPGRAA
ncbi:hypothetical protein [Xanthomonas phage Olaya]|nr:hypothetical protein [Xanthomonas phage Olaya]